MRLATLTAVVALGLLAAAPASAGLIGTTASMVAPGLGVTPSSATVVAGAPEFNIFDMQGNVEDASFTLTEVIGDLTLGIPGNAISLTIAETIASIAVTIGPAAPSLSTSAFSFSGNTLNVAIGALGDVPVGVLFTVDFTFASTPVPEPASLALLGAGLLGLGAATRRKRARRG